MCDDGRLSYKYLNAPRAAGRAPRAGARPAARRRSPAATQAAAAELRPHAAAGTLAALLSPVASLEDLLAAAAVARDGLGLREVFVGGRPDGRQDDFLKRADENPNRKGLELVAAGLRARPAPLRRAAGGHRGGPGEGGLGGGRRAPRPGRRPRLRPAGGLRAARPSTRASSRRRPPCSCRPRRTASRTAPSSTSRGGAQRFELAYWPRGASAPHWSLASGLGRGARPARAARPAPGRPGGSWAPASARRSPASPGTACPPPPARRSLVPLPSGTVDGRLPGYRERVPSTGSGDTRLDLLQTP